MVDSSCEQINIEKYSTSHYCHQRSILMQVANAADEAKEEEKEKEEMDLVSWVTTADSLAGSLQWTSKATKCLPQKRVNPNNPRTISLLQL